MRNRLPITRSVLVILALAVSTQFSSLNYAQEDVVARTADGTLNDDVAQTDEKKDKVKTGEYDFTIEHNIDCSDVKSQGKTGTCWSFATASFVESELLRREKGQHNLSEMFIVRNIYKDKAHNYVLRKGKANFSQGALAHDFINSADRFGLVPEEVFSGLDDGQTKHDHGEMESAMLEYLEDFVKPKKRSSKLKIALNKTLDVCLDAYLDTYLGTSPERFTYRNRSYSPKEFAESLGFQGKDYVNLTSFTHHPFYQPFVLEIPDNYSNGSFENLPIDDLMKTIDSAIENGYSVAWDGDVSEKGFSSKNGIAILPTDSSREDKFTKPGKEIDVDQELRQETFESFSTTDDHLMHLVGISRDSNGNKYYMVKNSWGEIGPYKGFIHLSEAYVRLKTISVIVHRDAVPADVKTQMEASQ